MKELLSHLSARAQRLYDSDIQDMIELVHQNQALSFTAGEPSEDLLPLEKLRSSFAAAFDRGPEMLTYYHDSDGHEDLRRWIASWMRSDGLIPSCMDWKQLMLTTGSHEGINITAEGLIDPGDSIAVEAPSYAEALLTFSKEGAAFFGLEMDQEGPRPESLELLARQHRIKLLYTIPNFQNPSGRVTSPKRRREILELAKKYDFLILEDDPYRHLYYDAPPPGTYLAMKENDGRVIYLGSFSKLIAPGIRCGWMIAPPELYGKFHQIRVTNDLNLPTILHEGIFRFLSDYDFQEHLTTLRRAYGEKRNGMVKALQKHIAPEDFAYDLPKGGFFLWGRAPWLQNSMEFAKFAVTEDKIGIIPGEIFFTSPENYRDTLRLSFAKVSPEKAEEGCARLARSIERYKRQRQV
jgi:2-aminoadipate transaminase